MKTVGTLKDILFAATLLFAISVPSQAASIVIGTPGIVSNAFPFGGEVAGVGTRYQQAYASTDFTGPISITGIDFLGGIGTLATSTYTLSLSTITAGIDSLSNTNFANNLGANNTLFAVRTLSGVAPATLTFIGGPFLYNPASGNLLLDIIVSPGGVDANGGGAGARYLSNTSGDAIGIFSRYHNFGSGTIGFGLVTQFDFNSVAVPEPSPLVLIALGVALVSSRRFARY